MSVVPGVSSQVGLVVANRVPYVGLNNRRIEAQEKLYEKLRAAGVAEEDLPVEKDKFVSSGTTYSVALTLNQTDARSVFGPYVGKGPLEAASLQVNTYTNLDAW